MFVRGYKQINNCLAIYLWAIINCVCSKLQAVGELLAINLTRLIYYLLQPLFNRKNVHSRNVYNRINFFSFWILVTFFFVYSFSLFKIRDLGVPEMCWPTIDHLHWHLNSHSRLQRLMCSTRFLRPNSLSRHDYANNG